MKTEAPTAKIKNKMKKIVLIVFLVVFNFIILTPTSFALTPTPTPAPNMANCDVCGYCQDTKTSLEERWRDQGKKDDQIEAEWNRWVANWRKCQQCLYPDLLGDPDTLTPDTNVTLIGLPTPDPERHYTIIGCISTNPGEFTGQISQFFFRIVGGIAFLFLLYGAGVVVTSRADPERLNQGKRIIYGAIIGLLFVLFSAFIFNFIAANILKIPGFGG